MSHPDSEVRQPVDLSRLDAGQETCPLAYVWGQLLVGEEPCEIFDRVVLIRNEGLDVVVGHTVVVLHRR